MTEQVPTPDMLVQVYLPADLARRVDEYRKQQRIHTMEFALYSLVAKAIYGKPIEGLE